MVEDRAGYFDSFYDYASDYDYDDYGEYSGSYDDYDYADEREREEAYDREREEAYDRAWQEEQDYLDSLNGQEFDDEPEFNAKFVGGSQACRHTSKGKHKKGYLKPPATRKMNKRNLYVLYVAVP